ncbi:MAG TPA: hypothetical protein VGI57_05480 [Usitatibacter sp.]
MIVHITRGVHSGGEKLAISRKEWRALCESDPELKPDGQDSIRWTESRESEFCLLVWRDGDIEAIDPPPELMEKMAALAARLHATVAKHEKLLEDFLARKQARRGPLHLDPLSWQIVAWSSFALIAVFAILVLLIVTRRIG